MVRYDGYVHQNIHLEKSIRQLNHRLFYQSSPIFPCSVCVQMQERENTALTDYVSKHGLHIGVCMLFCLCATPSIHLQGQDRTTVVYLFVYLYMPWGYFRPTLPLDSGHQLAGFTLHWMAQHISLLYTRKSALVGRKNQHRDKVICKWALLGATDQGLWKTKPDRTASW